MKRKAYRIIILSLTIVLLASGMLNIVCIRRTLSYYRTLQLSRLDPADEKIFAAKNLQLREPEAGKVRIILFGDSRIAYWDPLPTLQNCQWINRGISGQTTAQTLLRLEGDVIRLKPAIAVMQVGINDLKTIGLLPESRNEVIRSCWENLSTIVQQVTAHDIRTVVLTVFPPGPVNLLRRPTWSDDICHGIEEVNEMIRELRGRRITVVDCDSILTFEETIKPEFVRDTFHLTSAGYEALNNSLRPVLNELVQDHLRLQN